MQKLYFVVHSLTMAQHAANWLRQNGVDSELVKTPRSVSNYGCSYSVAVSERNSYAARQCLKDSGIPYLFSYRIIGGTVMREEAR